MRFVQVPLILVIAKLKVVEVPLAAVSMALTMGTAKSEAKLAENSVCVPF